MKLFIHIFILSLMALQAQPVLKCLSDWGGFGNGSGWDGKSTGGAEDNFFGSAPLLCNDGSVYFIAPMRSKDGIPPTATSTLVGVYSGNPFSSSSNCENVLKGYREFIYVITGLVYELEWRRVGGDGSRNLVVCTARDVPLSGNSSVIITKLGAEVDEREVGGETFPANASLSVAGYGGLVSVGDLTSSYSFRDSSLDKVELDLSGDGRAVGISPGSNLILFASEEALAGNSAGNLWIYSYNRADGTVQPVVQVEDGAHGKLQDGAEISYAAASEAFAFVTNRSSLLDDSGNDYVNSYQRQVVLAKRGDDGEWSYTWCDNGSHLHECSAPAVSADGRFVAFAARGASGFAQIYRYDSLTGEIVCASKAEAFANARCKAPSISPNGRYVGFVTKAGNLGYANVFDKPNAWIADFGPVLNYDSNIYVYGTSATPLPISVEAANKGATMKISWSGTLPGEFYRMVGTKKVPVVSGAAFSANEGALYFTRTSDGSVNLTLVLTDGTFVQQAECSLTCLEHLYPSVEHLSYVLDGNERVFANVGGYSISGGQFALSGDGKTFAYTTLAKSKQESYSAAETAIVVRTLSGGSKVVENSGVTGKMELTSDGSLLFYKVEGGIQRYDVKGGAGALFIEEAEDFAVSSDGAVCAYVKGGVPYVNGVSLSDDSGFAGPIISSEGNVAAFMNGDSLYLWKGGELRPLADGVSQAFLTMSGASVLVVQNGELRWLGAKDGTVAMPCDLAAAKALCLSANGRFLAYCRTDGKQQAFRFDLHTGTEEPMSVELDGTYADSDVNPKLALSADGSRLLFATAAMNLVAGKEYPLNNELYMATVKNDVNTSASSADETLSYDETSAEVVLPLSFTDAEGNDAVPELLSAPSGMEMELLPPDWEHAWYSLKCVSRKEHLCGVFSVRIRYWDGAVWSAAQEVILNVVNVNDAPFWNDGATVEYTVSEGRETTGCDYSLYADDYDLANPAPYDGETLSFSLQDAPVWISLEDGVLKMNPDYDVTTRGVNRRIEFSVIVTDKAGEAAALPVSVNVCNTNRSPEIAVDEIEIYEGKEIPWETFAASDPDAGDSLSLRLSTGGGKWYDRSGAAIAGDAAMDRFPIHFKAKAGLYNEYEEDYSAVDADAAVSANKAKVKIRLKSVRYNASDVWPEVFAGTAMGWQLLSVPFSVDSDVLSNMFGADLFIWDGKAYRKADGTLNAGCGFLTYIESVPANRQIDGERELLPTIISGWNLLGPTIDSKVIAIPNYVLKDSVYIKNTTDVALGKGCWIFVLNP